MRPEAFIYLVSSQTYIISGYFLSYVKVSQTETQNNILSMKHKGKTYHLQNSGKAKLKFLKNYKKAPHQSHRSTGKEEKSITIYKGKWMG